MPSKRRYRLVEPVTWQDGLEVLVVMAVFVCSKLVFSDWRVCIDVCGNVFWHILQIFMFFVQQPRVEWTNLCVAFDLLALSLQFGVFYKYIGPDFRVDLSASDPYAYNIAKLGLIGGLVLMDFLRYWQFYDMENDVDENGDPIDAPPQQVRYVAMAVAPRGGYGRPKRLTYD